MDLLYMMVWNSQSSSWHGSLLRCTEAAYQATQEPWDQNQKLEVSSRTQSFTGHSKKTARAQHLSTNIVNFHEAPWSFCFTIFTFRIISHHAAAGGDVVPKSSSNETRQRFACQVCQVCWGGHGWKSCRTKVQVGKPDRTNANSC